MMVKHIFSRVFLAFALLFAVSSSAADSRTEEAVTVAENWVQLVDEGHYETSWDQTSAFFRSVITAAQWAEAVTEVRDPLGDIVSRTLTSATYTETLPNAPVGEYVVIKYSTDFANRLDSIETVTVMIDDQRWKVTGYFVK